MRSEKEILAYRDAIAWATKGVRPRSAVEQEALNMMFGHAALLSWVLGEEMQAVQAVYEGLVKDVMVARGDGN
jgi:hypothetical protein